MLTTLPTLKLRLALQPADTQYDSLLTTALQALGPRLDSETNRTLARTVDYQQEFDSASTEVLARCYPIESISKFELKYNDTDGWQEIPNVKTITRNSCIISLNSQLSTLNSSRALARVTYTGGYVLPGTTPAPGQTPLPLDLENAAIEQIAFWFTNRDKTGLKTSWPTGEYRQFATQDLLPSVSAVLAHHRRIAL